MLDFRPNFEATPSEHVHWFQVKYKPTYPIEN